MLNTEEQLRNVEKQENSQILKVTESKREKEMGRDLSQKKSQKAQYGVLKSVSFLNLRKSLAKEMA